MNFDLESIELMKSRLLEVGYVNDEECLGANAFERLEEEVFADLGSIGYSDRLDNSAKHFDGYGTVYWFNNPELVSEKEAEALTVQWVKSKKGANK